MKIVCLFRESWNSRDLGTDDDDDVDKHKQSLRPISSLLLDTNSDIQPSSRQFNVLRCLLFFPFSQLYSANSHIPRQRLANSPNARRALETVEPLWVFQTFFVMDGEDKRSSLAIPTYEEATSSRPSSSQDFRGSREVSDDAERQGLLRDGTPQGGGRGGVYRPPTVESPRSSEESDLHLPEVNGSGEDARRQIEELDYLDPADEAERLRSSHHRARLRYNLSKSLASLSATFSSLRLPSIRSLYTPVAGGEAGVPASEPSRTPPTWRERLRFVSIPDQYKISLPIAARLGGLFLISSMIYLLFIFDVFPSGRRLGARFDPEAVREFVQGGVSRDNIAAYLHHITSYDHVAGTEGDYYLVNWMKDRWMEFEALDQVQLQEYFVYLNYPTTDGRSVKIVDPKEKRWKAALEEDILDVNVKQTLAWHGHSKTGTAKGQVIFANSGSSDDYTWLKSKGVETTGAIALVRYGGTRREGALKIKAAEEAGCVGVLIYTDPRDERGGKTLAGRPPATSEWTAEGWCQRDGVDRWRSVDPWMGKQ